MKKPVGVVQFPGTNCDRDVFKAVGESGQQAQFLWHMDQFDCKAFSAVVLPGGFSYGDYLRSGAMAARSPVMKSVSEGAKKGLPILGICNGFQILCEAGLLPGALVKNQGLRFVDRWCELRHSHANPYFSAQLKQCEKISLPVAHGDGRYYAPQDVIKELQDFGLIWWQYEDNPNGSFMDIAGVMSKNKNVAGLMPHPERAMHEWMGGSQGAQFFTGHYGVEA